MNSTNRRIVKLLVGVSLLFLSLIVYLVGFQLFGTKPYTDNAYDPRNRVENQRLLRGSIYDRRGARLAYSEWQEDGTQRRIYPYEGRYAHTIGYCSPVYGRSALELTQNDYLSGSGAWMTAYTLVAGETESGADVYLTLDNKLQARAEACLAGKEGAVVVLNPKSGAVLAMYTSPSFSPTAASLEANWGSLLEAGNAPLLNRATSGGYAPGSAFKLLTLCGAIENGMEHTVFEDTGVFVADGKEFKNAGEKVYGSLSLSEAFAKSSNTVFADIAVRLGADKINKLASRFGLNTPLGFEISSFTSGYDESFVDEAALAAFGIGQGTLAVTPLYMASLAAAIYNDGVMMQPYLTEQVVLKGTQLYRHNAKAERTVTDAVTAEKMRDCMLMVVQDGTGTAAKTSCATVYGKTGTAENETDKAHAWFIGFAEGEGRDGIAFAVLLSYSGSSGGSVCAPIARELINTWYTE